MAEFRHAVCWVGDCKTKGVAVASVPSASSALLLLFLGSQQAHPDCGEVLRPAPTMLTVLTQFSASVLTLIILVPIRPSREKVISMPSVRRNVCARRSRPASARGFRAHAPPVEMSLRALSAQSCRRSRPASALARERHLNAQGPQERTPPHRAGRRGCGAAPARTRARARFPPAVGSRQWFDPTC